MVLKKKRELRKRVQEERDRLSPETIAARSEVVLDKLWSLPQRG
jgi:5-formyltetrahydrofolate cyclo-ligase